MWYAISFLCLLIGVLGGWLAAERYVAFMQHVEHEYETLFKKNPHPELFDKNGSLDRSDDYIAIVFEPGFNPDEWDPETDIELEE